MKYSAILLAVLIIFINCYPFSTVQHQKIATLDSNTTKLAIHFRHCINDTPALFNKLVYTNTSGNRYMLKELQYFISEIVLERNDGTKVTIDQSLDIHYVDNDKIQTLNLVIPILNDTGTFRSFSFRFGLSKHTNRSYRFKNPPENLMAWPDMLGGGYHYMKLNLKYVDKNGQLSNFNCHLGSGKTEDTNTTAIIDNSFTVTLVPSSSFTIQLNKTTDLQLLMNINKWFDGIHPMNMNDYDGIMDNQKAMQQFCENGTKAFGLITIR